MKRIRPRGFKSGMRNARGWPRALQIASAAKWPERAALSIVEGQPVAIQSPARKQFGHGAAEAGLATIDSWRYTKCGTDFFHQCCFFQFC